MRLHVQWLSPHLNLFIYIFINFLLLLLLLFNLVKTDFNQVIFLAYYCNRFL